MERVPDAGSLLDKIYQIIRLFKPELWKWMVRILVISGLSLLCRPFWQSLLEALLRRELNMSSGTVDITGWILLTAGFLLYFLERKGSKIPPASTSGAPGVPSGEAAGSRQRTADPDLILSGRRAGRSHLLAAAIRRARVLGEAGYPMAVPTQDAPDERLRRWGMVRMISTSVLADIVPVSETDYVEFCRDVGLPLPGYLESAAPRDDLPVVFVSAFEAEAYARWSGKRLPSLGEWRDLAFLRPDGSRAPYPWGDTFSSNLCNSLQSCIGERTPFARYLAGRSFSGALDLAGNTWDWLQDGDGTDRLIVGGSYCDNSKYCKDGEAIRWDPAGRVKDIGFRCVIDA